MSTKAERSEAAKILSAKGAKMGGVTKWAGLSAQERSEHVKKMLAARWAGHVKKAPRAGKAR